MNEECEHVSALRLREIIRLLQENDKLRAELLKAPNAQMVAFIAAFEVWLEEDHKTTADCDDTYPGSYGGGMLSQSRYTIRMHKTLKAQHLEQETAE